MNIPLISEACKSANIIRAELELKRSGRTSFICHQLMPHPFHITVPFQYDTDPSDLITLYMQSSAGGLYDKDLHKFNITLHEGSKLHLTSQASTIVHRAKEMVGAKSFVNLNLTNGTVLEYLPDPIILMAGCKFSSQSKINLNGDCKAIIAESFLAHDPSASGEMFESLFSETQIFRNNEQTIDEKFYVSGNDFFSRIKGFTCIASFYIYGFKIAVIEKLKAVIKDIPGSYAGFSYFEKSNLIVVKILAREPNSLLRITESTWAIAREDMTGLVPSKRRK